MSLANPKLPLIDDARPAVRIASRVVIAIACAALAVFTVEFMQPILGRSYIFPAFIGVILSAFAAGARYVELSAVIFLVSYAFQVH
jgi:hypothetical protein